MQEPQRQTALENCSLIKPMTPLEFISQTRNRILGNKPQQLEVDSFNQTFAGRAINVIERCQMLSDQRLTYPDLQFEGTINSNGLSKSSNKFLTYHLPKAFILYLYEDGKVEIEPPLSVPKHILKDDTYAYDAKTDLISSSLSDEVVQRLLKSFELVEKYYLGIEKSIENKAWKRKNFHETGDVNDLSPYFPDLNQLLYKK